MCKTLDTTTKERINAILSKVLDKNELNSQIGTYEDEPFLIVEGWDERELIEKKIHCNLDSIIENGFSDEYTTCSGCCNIIKTSPDSYSWTPDYHIFESAGEILCKDCIDFDSYVEDIQNKPKKANTLYEDKDFEEHDYKKHNTEEFEAGWYNHYDNPQDIYNKLKGTYSSIVFSITNNEQFRTCFDVWVKND